MGRIQFEEKAGRLKIEDEMKRDEYSLASALSLDNMLRNVGVITVNVNLLLWNRIILA
jgi:hypothetical protein